MESKIVLVVYKPRPGKGDVLESLVAKHLTVLKQHDLVTGRIPVVMKAKGGAIIEVFEWRSSGAISKAHSNPDVLKLWEEFNAACEYEKPVNIEEFHNLFSEFEPLNF
jgi:hypothetical protein